MIVGRQSSAVDFVLASASPRRCALLEALGLAFEVRPADVEEVVNPALGALETARKLARRKARTVAHRAGWATLAADTVVELAGRPLGKPADAEEATAMLRALSGQEHQVITAVAFAPSGAPPRVEHVASRVWLRPLDEATIAAYVASGRPMDKAGAYAIQDEDVRLAERFDGCYCNIMGLPLWTAVGLLASAGIRPPRQPHEAYARCATCPLRR